MHAEPTSENAILLGSWFASHRQFECAVDTFRDALKADPNSAQLYYLEGLALIGWGHDSEAALPLQESIRLQPEVIKSHLLLATLFERFGQSDKAEEQWRKALEIDPHSTLALEGLSAELLERKDYIGVVGLLQHAPRTETLAINLAKAYGILNYLDAASAVLHEALKISPHSLPLANAESVVLIKQLHYDEATRLLSAAVQQHPGSFEAQLLLFRVLVLTQHIDRARPLAPKLLAQMPHDPSVLYLSGIVERTDGETALAKAHLEEAVSLDPDFFYSRFNLGKVLVILHEWKEAKEQLEKAIALGEIEPEVHYELAMALRGLGEEERAVQEIKQYQDLRKAEEDRLEASMTAAQGDKELEAGNIEQAITQFRSACNTMPDNANYRFKLSVALHKAGDIEGERAELEETVKLDPHLAGAQRQLGYLLSRNGDADGAVEHFKMAVQSAPAWVEAWINLAAELASEAQFEEARKAITIALRLDPANEQARELRDQLTRDATAQKASP
jgi:tetratricopeptide (TPR) repeat protein